MSTGNRRDELPGTGVPCSFKMMLRMTCIRPAKEMKMMGVRSWQTLVPMARDCNVRSLRNCETKRNENSCAHAKNVSLFFQGYIGMHNCVVNLPTATQSDRHSSY